MLPGNLGWIDEFKAVCRQGTGLSKCGVCEQEEQNDGR